MYTLAQAIRLGHTAGQHVQVRRRGVTYCCTVIGLGDHPARTDVWLVQTLMPAHGRMLCSFQNVRQCAGVDGRCFCASEDLLASQAARSAASTACDAEEDVRCQ